MNRTPSISARMLIKVLRKRGFVEVPSRGSHHRFAQRDIYLTQPGPTGSVLGDDRGLSPDAAGSGEAICHRPSLPRVSVRAALAGGFPLSAVRGAGGLGHGAGGVAVRWVAA